MRLLDRGASIQPDGRTRFSVWAPRPERVELGLRHGCSTRAVPMARGEDGVWQAVASHAPAGTEYWYRLDAERDRPDPVSRHLPRGVHGSSRVVEPAAFRWSDGEWRGRAMADLAIYELHVGTFTAEGTFDSAVSRLPSLVDLGVTAIELMPVAEFPGARNWGYDGVSLYAPQSSYGGPEALRRLVDAAHGAGLAVLLDVVYNHLGPEGNYLSEYGPYFSNRYPTAWGEGFNLDGAESGGVRRYLVDNAVYWITEYHLDGLRLDAADRILDSSPLHLGQEIAEAVHAQGAALGRRTLVIGEVDSNDPRWVRPAEAGGYGLDARWSDDFHHAVHVALTGERTGYYSDCGGVADVARVVGERCVHAGDCAPYRRRPHGRPAGDLPADRFVVCVQNHDQVGNRPAGERLAALVEPPALRLAAAILLLSPYVPLLFMGEEHGEAAPFLYFVSHGDPELAAAVREGRRREFAALGWRSEMPNPQAEATFEASRPCWDRAEAESGAALRALYRDLLRLRRTEPVLRPGAAGAVARHDGEAEWVALRVTGEDDVLEAVFNFASGPRAVPVSGRVEAVLSTESPAYGGAGGTRVEPGRVVMPGRSALLLRVAR